MIWFFWRGYGFLVPLVGLIVGGGIVECLESLFPGNEAQFFAHQSIGLLFAALALWFLGKKLHTGPETVFINKTTGQEHTVKPNHTFYWVKMQYWAYILIGFAIFMLGMAYEKGQS